MPRRTSPEAKLETRRRALDRHAMTRKLERREKWLERGGVTPERFKLAVDTLVAGMTATKVLERGPRAGESVPDQAVRVKAAAEFMDFSRLVLGLTKEPSAVKGAEPPQVAIVVNVPEWLAPRLKEPAPAVAAITDAEVVDAESTDEGGES